MGSRNHISFSMVSMALVTLTLGIACLKPALAHQAAAASPFCDGLPAEQAAFCGEALQGETEWQKAIVAIVKATIKKVKSAEYAARSIGSALPASVPESDRENIDEKCHSGFEYALHNLRRSVKRIRSGVYARTDNVVYSAWAGIFECSGALNHFKLDMSVGPFKVQDEAEKAVGACHAAVTNAMNAGGLTHFSEET